MQKDLVRYIIKYYQNLINEDESKILSLFASRDKIMHAKEKGAPAQVVQEMIEHKGLTKLKLEEIDKIDASAFREKVASRIFEENSNLYINKCPICGTIARTPEARQAPCGHRW